MKAKLILASSSPRRKWLLQKLGLRFSIQVAPIDEKPRRNEIPLKYVKRMAKEKAKACIKTFEPSGYVVSADTIVVSKNNRILGKPRNKAEALRMLGELSGRPHQVITAYCIGFRGTLFVRAVRTRVTIRNLSRKEILAYFATGECMDKAGAYAAQEAGMAIIEKIHGSYTNVVGLPAAEFIRDLRKIGYKNGTVK